MSDPPQRHPAITAALDRFAYSHLPEDLQPFSAKFAELAGHIATVLPDDPATTEALWFLWHTKNCAVYVAARIGYTPPHD
jgi:hypothetical protein